MLTYDSITYLRAADVLENLEPGQCHPAYWDIHCLAAAALRRAAQDPENEKNKRRLNLLEFTVRPYLPLSISSSW